MSNKISEKLIKRFCKDYGVKVQVHSKFLFESRLEVLSKMSDYSNITEYYDLFKSILSNEFDNNNSLFLAELKHCERLVIDTITRTEAYSKFITDSSFTFAKSDELCETYLNIPTNQLYTEANDGKLLVSFDLIKANYNSLKEYDPNLVLNTATYSDLIDNVLRADGISEQFRTYFAHSKYTRQVIFGNSSTKRQQALQKIKMSNIVSNLSELVEFIFKSPDEVIMDFTNIPDVDSFIRDSKKWFKDFGYDNVRVTKFRLSHIKDNVCVKLDDEDNVINIHNCPNYLYSQYIPTALKLGIKPNDLIFTHESGEQAKFSRDIFKRVTI